MNYRSVALPDLKGLKPSGLSDLVQDMSGRSLLRMNYFNPSCNCRIAVDVPVTTPKF